MDRATASSVPFELEAPAAGWDSHAVWRERIHAPRQPLRKASPGFNALVDSSTGWDPLETWRARVQRSRATLR